MCLEIEKILNENDNWKDILTQKQGGFCDLITKLFTCCEKCETRNLESKADHI